MASSNRVKGITIEIGGDATGLDKALSDVNKNINDTQRNLKDINKLLKLDPTNTELVAQKQKQLQKATEETSKKLDKLKNAAKDAAQQLERGEISSDQYDALQREIIECEQELDGLIAETEALKDSAEDNIPDAGAKFEEFGSKITGIGKAVSVASAAVVALGKKCLDIASDTSESMNKVDVAFGDSAGSVKEFAKTTLKSYGIAEGSALDMAALFGDMGTSMGLSQSKAADMSKSMVGLAGDLSSFKNIGLEQSMSALKGVFTGESEGLKNIGVVMTQTNLDAYALSKGMGKTTSEMTEAEKVTLRYKYVMEKTKNAQGDFARTADGTANSFRIFQESLKELGAALGAQLMPVVTPIVQKMTQLVQKMTELPEPAQKVIAYIGMAVAVLGPLLLIIGTVVSTIGKVVTALSSIGPIIAVVGTAITSTLIPAMGAVGSALAGLLANPVVLTIVAIIAAIALLGVAIYELVKHWDEVKKATINAWNSIKDTLSKNTFTSFIAKDMTILEEGIRAGIEDARQAFQNAGGGWKGALEASVKVCLDYYKTAMKLWLGINDEQIGNIKKSFSDGFKNVKRIFNDLWNNVIPNAKAAMQEFVKLILEKIKALPGEIAEGLKNLKEDLFNSISAPFKDVINGAKTWGKDLVDNFIGGIKDTKNKLTSTMANVAAGINSYIGFSEPEKGPLSDFHTYAPDMIDLWVQGVKANMYKIQEATNMMASTMNPNSTMQGMALESTVDNTASINALGDVITQGFNSMNTNVTVVLQGDAKGVFKLVRQENNRMIKTTGYHALA